MDWWMPFAVVAAALVASIIAPAPRWKRRAVVDEIDDDDHVLRAPPVDEPAPRSRRRSSDEPGARTISTFDEDALADSLSGPGVSPLPRRDKPARAPRPAAPPRPSAGVRGGQESYVRDPSTLQDWPQAEAVEDAVNAFLDRWGGAGSNAATFRKVETTPGSSERAFAFLLAVEPERGGKETALLARIVLPEENAARPSRFVVTKYFDHIGARFREDVAKTPQHSRGVITVRDVAPDDAGRGGVALDYEAVLNGGDPYDDIRSDDVAQYKNLLNIMRMFA